MNLSDPADPAEAERWLIAHGLPWFVRGVDDRVGALVAPRRLTPVVGLLAVLAGIVGWLVARATDLASGLSVAVAVALLLSLAYAGGPLRLGTMARWAARQALTQLWLVLPLVLRALPMLLLFTTFLFINTEVWQVAGSLSLPRLWAAVLVFTVLGTAFLLTRLPEEVRRVEQAVAGDGTQYTELRQIERVNLVIVLLVLQSLQVFLLALVVFGFFVGFGVLAIGDDVIRTWMGDPAVPSLQIWQSLGVPVPISGELVKVSVFLAAFGALYFTIYAVSDPTYRTQFFAHIDTELERAVGVRAAYRSIR
ncbi:MAG: hypothetical protein WAL50_03625 [Kineosporiaceae bacterium]